MAFLFFLGDVIITFSSDGDELNAFTGDEIQRFVDIGDLVESHFTTVGLWQRLTRDNFKQEHELESIAEVIFNVINAGTGLAQVRVAPRGKSLLFKIKKTKQN